MKRLSTSIILSLLLLTVSGASTAMAAGSKVAAYMGDLRWGMSESDVLRYLERGISKTYKGAEARRMLSDVKDSLVEFDGQHTRWDDSVVAGEFTHGNTESMIYFDGGSYQSYYFFIEGRLWKWVKTIDAQKLGGRNFGKLGKTLGKRFGRGHKSKGERNPEAGKQQWYEYRDRQTRMRAVDATGHYGQYALVFSELETVGQLSTLRVNSKKRSKPSRRARTSVASRSPATGIGKRRKSLFDNSPKQESEAEYRQRVKREQAAARAKQRRAHERKQLKKHGKALKGMGSLESDDPLSGI